jgi:hypothetical protein
MVVNAARKFATTVRHSVISDLGRAHDAGVEA